VLILNSNSHINADHILGGMIYSFLNAVCFKKEKIEQRTRTCHYLHVVIIPIGSERRRADCR